MGTTHEAYLSQELLENGLGHAIILRKKSPQKVEAGVFLIDSYCLGLRDAFLYQDTEGAVNEKLVSNPQTLQPKAPAYVRKFIEEAIAYAKRYGFAPHKDFKKAARVFGGLKASADLEGFTFGKDGKPFYIQSQYHSADDASRIVGKLTRICGEGGFDFLLKLDEDESFEVEDEVEERILLFEGSLGDDHTPQGRTGENPSEAAKRVFLEFAAQDQFAGDPLFDNPLWVPPNSDSLLDALLEIVDALIEAGSEGYEGEPPESRSLFLSFFMVLMNLHDQEEEVVEKHFANLQSDPAFPEETINFLKALRTTEEIQMMVENLVHPEPGITIRPMSLEMIDESSGHCLLICLEEYDPDDV